MRVNPNFSSTVINDIEQSDQALQTAYQQVSTNQKVNVASDNPSAAAVYVTLQSQAANLDQYTTNAESVLSQAQTADSILSSVVSLLNRAITIGTEGASSSSSADNSSLASDIKGILSNVVSLANTSVGGVSLFGGSVSGTTVFKADASSSTGYTYNGNDSVNTATVGNELSIQINIPGDTLFTNGSASVLGSLSDLASALASGSSTDIGAAANSITTALNYISQQHAVYGATINTLTSQEEYLSQESVTLTSQETSLVGIDAATAAEELSSAEVQNSAVYEASAKILQNSLLNYLQN